jgi:hypothetical protein
MAGHWAPFPAGRARGVLQLGATSKKIVIGVRGVAVAPVVGAWTPRAHGAREGRVRGFLGGALRCLADSEAPPQKKWSSASSSGSWECPEPERLPIESLWLYTAIGKPLVAVYSLLERLCRSTCRSTCRSRFVSPSTWFNIQSGAPRSILLNRFADVDLLAGSGLAARGSRSK